MAGEYGGTECEWGLTSPGNNGWSVVQSVSTLALNRWDLDVQPGAKPGGYTRDGGRVYEDIGIHPETATPECKLDDLEDLLACEQAQARKLGRLVLTAARQRWPGTEVRLNRRSVDAEGTTSGYHLNLTSYQGVDYQTMVEQETLQANLGVAAFVNAIRCLITGAGAIVHGRFVTGQKISQATDDFGTVTTSGVTVVNLRRIPYGAVQRIHDTTPDPNMNPFGTRMNVALAQAAWTLVEAGIELPAELRPPERRNPFAALGRAVAQDRTGHQVHHMANGRTLKTYELHWAAYELLQSHYAGKELTPGLTFLFKHWPKIITAFERKELLSLEDRVEWVARQAWLVRQAREHKQQGQKLPPGLELLWDDYAHPDDCVGIQLQQTLWKPWMPPEELIAARAVSPPENTRAVARVELLKQLTGPNRPVDQRDTWDAVYDNMMVYELWQPESITIPAPRRVLPPSPDVALTGDL